MPPDDIELDRTKNPYKTLYFSHFPGFTGLRRTMKWWAHQDSNLEPKDYESSALTVEL